MSLDIPYPDPAVDTMEKSQKDLSQDSESVVIAQKPCKSRDWLKFAPLWIILILVATIGLTWYLLEVGTTPVLRIPKLYACSLKIVSHELTYDLTRPASKAFKTEAEHLQKLVSDLVLASELAVFYNSSTVYAFGEGSLIVYFWLSLEVPDTHSPYVTMNSVKAAILSVMKAKTSIEGTYIFDQYHVDPNSFDIQEAKWQDRQLHSSAIGCYRYTYVHAGQEIHLKGPDYLYTTCTWHLQGPPGHLLKVWLKWTRPDCRDRLIMYDSAAPLASALITSHYGCTRQEPESEVLSSGNVMLVLWKQGMYNYDDPFMLTVQPLPIESCQHSIVLKKTLEIQGQLRTPYYPSYCPPNFNCTWNFMVPSPDYGIVLHFEGYKLTRQYTYEPCFSGLWLVQTKRMCGLRLLQSYSERIFAISGNVTVSFTNNKILTGPGIQASYSLFNLSDPCPGEFLCITNGLCVPLCDGVKDCSNELDERNCVCPAQYQCSESGPCISVSQVCDGNKDCVNGTDEKNCEQAVPCSAFTYKCEDGSCVKKPNPECDSVHDCRDKSDEKKCDCGVQALENRLIGGVTSQEGEWPWQASLQVQGIHVCGGSLIANRWILSAAHCFHPERFASPEIWTVVLGKIRLSRSSQKEMSFKVTRLVLHPFYDEDSHDYDVALVLLDHAVPLTSPHVQPVCLPSGTHYIPTDSICWVTGWGAANEYGPSVDTLQKVDLKIVSQDVCSDLYRYQISPRMFCAGYRDGSKDACLGDSGSPLVCKVPRGRWVQFGLVSWGAGCGIPKYFGVYSRLTRLVGWIHNVTGVS
ncbi:transmembrane protease serine 6 isoform X1 [Pelobates fuscus]|uniref:transmembrane protease serine 6 isoform X1 n=1 Tax=Pelobates fuscus TaxID=191477 RepID=UPI002FE4DC26